MTDIPENSALTIAFEGPQTIANVESAYGRLHVAVISGQALEIDLGAVTEADLAFLQVLIAIRKSAIAIGQGLSWRGNTNQSIADVVTRGGLTNSAIFTSFTPTGDAQ